MAPSFLRSAASRLVLLLSVFGAASAAGAAPVAVPGTSVQLVPPPGFALTDRFPGFADAASGASLMVTEMPAPVAQIRVAMTAEQLATRGITLLTSETVATAAGEVLLVGARQRAPGVGEVRKWLAVSGDATRTLMVVATWPPERGDLEGPLRAAALSAGPAGKEPDLFDGLPFTLSGSGALAIAGRVSNALMVTEGGTRRILGPGEPVLVAAASISGVDLSNLEQFAAARLRQTEQLTGPWESTGAAVEVGGLSGWELEATATDRKSGARVRVYQLVVQDGPRSYFIAQGMVAPERWEELAPQFRAVGRSLRRAR